MLDYGLLGSPTGGGDEGGRRGAAQTAQLHKLDAGWNHTVKHLQGMVQGEREARYAVQMATVIAGGAAELRRCPPLSDLTFTVSAAGHQPATALTRR